MYLGLFFSLVLVINYLLITFLGQNYLTNNYKNHKGSLYLILFLTMLGWLVAALITYALLFFLFVQSNTASLAPIVFMMLTLLVLFLLKFSKLNKMAAEDINYQSIATLINSLFLAMLFLEPVLVASVGRLCTFVGLTTLAILLSMTLSYHFNRHLMLAPLSRAWQRQPINILIASLIALALMMISHF